MCSVRKNPFLHSYALGQFQGSYLTLIFIWNLQSDGHNTIFIPSVISVK